MEMLYVYVVYVCKYISMYVCTVEYGCIVYVHFVYVCIVYGYVVYELGLGLEKKLSYKYIVVY